MENEIEYNIKQHSKNERVIGIVYYTCTLVGLILSTVVTLLLGSKSLNDVHDPVNAIAFSFNIVSSIILSIVNMLKLETKINKHHTTKREYEDLLLDLDDNDIVERLKLIKDHAPNLCFS